MSEPLGVSIVIPNYNFGRFIREAIDSALAQTHDAVEVIVVDDGSTDDSRAVIEDYGDRIKAIFQPNAGQLKACLNGVELARHPIVMFLDSDDALVPSAAATVAANWSPPLSKLQFQLATIDAASNRLGFVWPKFPPTLPSAKVREELLRTGSYPAPPTSGNAYSRAFIGRAAPLDGHHRYIDSVLNTVSPLYGDTKTLSRPLALYRLHGGNSWAQSSLTAERFAYYAESERSRMAVLSEHCARLSIQFAGPEVIEKSLYLREVELVRAKLSARSFLPGLDVIQHGARAVRAALVQPQGMWHRLMRAIWSGAVTVFPRPIARRLIEMRFVQTTRPMRAERIIALLSGGAQTADAGIARVST